MQGDRPPGNHAPLAICISSRVSGRVRVLPQNRLNGVNSQVVSLVNLVIDQGLCQTGVINNVVKNVTLNLWQRSKSRDTTPILLAGANAIQYASELVRVRETPGTSSNRARTAVVSVIRRPILVLPYMLRNYVGTRITLVDHHLGVEPRRREVEVDPHRKRINNLSVLHESPEYATTAHLPF